MKSSLVMFNMMMFSNMSFSSEAPCICVLKLLIHFSGSYTQQKVEMSADILSIKVLKVRHVIKLKEENCPEHVEALFTVV